MSELIGLCLGLVLFLCCVKAYTLGLQHGKEISKGKTPEINLNPVKAVVEAVNEVKERVEEIKEETEQQKREREFNQDLDNVFGYTRKRVVRSD